MRYPASDKLEIIRLVEQSRLPARQTLEKIGILPARFYRWYGRYQGTRRGKTDRLGRSRSHDAALTDSVRMTGMTVPDVTVTTSPCPALVMSR